MFVGVINSGTIINSASPYLWTQTQLTNSNISYNASTGTFTIRQPGFYKIHVDTSGTGAGIITPKLVLNGSKSTTALGSATSTSTTIVNIAFDTVVRVIPDNSGTFATIQIINDGAVSETATTGNIVITRIA